MEKLKNLSIKTSIILAVILGLVVASSCTLITVAWLDQQTSQIHEKYEGQGERYYLTNDIGQQIGEGTVIYTTPATPEAYLKEDNQKLRLFEIVRIISIPAYYVISLITAIFLIYHLKIQRPLKLLDAAAIKISQQNLDFTLNYPIKDEMGSLVLSIEQMRRALAENNQMMWQIADERKRVNAIFAHDLRTPLTVLKGYNSFLQENIRNPKLTVEKFQATSQLMEQQINRLEGFVESMSSIQKLEDISLAASKVKSNVLLQQAEEIINALQTDKIVTIHSTLKTELDSIDLEIVFQVFENLFANALRYAGTEISVHFLELEGLLTVIIEDDGPGFSKAALQNAKNPFYKEDDPAKSHFGLGIYISNVLCEKHKGELELTNQNGAKITATFKLL